MGKGFTLIEVIIVMAILVILVGLSSTNLVSFGKAANQSNGQAVVAGALQVAESNSMANLGASVWGVHLQSNQVVIFQGSAYSVGAKGNQVKLLPDNVNLGWNLTGGGSDIIFDQGKSTTVNSGYLTLTSSANNTGSVNINSEGMIE